LSAIEISSSAKTAALFCIFNSKGLLYLTILCIGNVAATLAASPVPTLEPKWFFQALYGVFGFELIIKNLNISVGDKGILTINEWITKARLGATAEAIEALADAQIRREMVLAERLKTLPIQDLNTYVLNSLGANSVTDLTNAANAAGANVALVKALALAKTDYKNSSKIRIP
jgi:hypothetical protein